MSNESKSTHLTESESSVLDSTQAQGIPVDDCHSSISYKEMEDNSTDVNVTDSLFTTITTTDVSSEPIVTKTMIDRKELQRDLDLAKIELTQRNLMIDSMKAQYLSQLEELEERVSDEMHEKQVLAVQFENRLRILKDGFMRENKRLQNEIQLLSDMLNKKGSSIMQQQGQSSEFKETFTNLEIDDSEYEVIKRKAIDDQSLWEFIAVKFYDSVKPLKVQCETLQNLGLQHAMEMNDKDATLANLMKELEEERKNRTELDLRCQRVEIRNIDLEDQLKKANYGSERSLALQRERDQLEEELLEVRKSLVTSLEAIENINSENNNLRIELDNQRQCSLLLRQDKVYLTKELSDLKPRHDLLEEKVRETSKMLEEARNAKEECYDKYISSRDRCKLEYEARLQKEIGELSAKTTCEIEKIKASSNQMYERECRALREARDDALREKQRFELSAKESDNRYKGLLDEYKQLQLSSDVKFAEIYSECNLRSFELERVQLVLEERKSDLKRSMLENDKAVKQKEELSKEYNALLLSTNKRIAELEARDLQMSRKLDIYEKMEEDLDSLVLQAAEIADNPGAEAMPLSFGSGSKVPRIPKWRLQQSIHLAQKVLQLERHTTSLKHQNEKEKQRNSILSKELSATEKLLSEVKQPYDCLIESIKARDDENKKLKNTIDSLTDDTVRLAKENDAMKTLNNQLTSDIERLLTQKEEVSLLKQTILEMAHSNGSDRDCGVETSLKCNSVGELRDRMDNKPDTEIPIRISEAPSWYTRLKFQNTRR